MKIQEVRTLLTGYSEETLRQMLSEIFKRIPKKVIEEQQLDLLIEKPQQYLNNKKGNAKQKATLSLPEVRQEVEQFIANAYADNYIAPNRVIPKSERPKWRFVVKRLNRELLILAKSPEDLLETSRLLAELYKLICKACGIYLFNTEDPFMSVGIDQPEFYRNVIAVLSKAKPPGDWIKEAIELIINHELSYDTLYTHLMDVLLEFLDTAPLKERAIQYSEELRGKGPAPRNRRNESKYANEDRNNNLTELIFKLQMALYEKEAAISDLKKHYMAMKEEIRLYVLLGRLLDYADKELWLREYEDALQQGIKPRQALTKTYNMIKDSGVLPRYMG